jgi:hypothetical protein
LGNTPPGEGGYINPVPRANDFKAIQGIRADWEPARRICSALRDIGRTAAERAGANESIQAYSSLFKAIQGYSEGVTSFGVNACDCLTNIKKSEKFDSALKVNVTAIENGRCLLSFSTSHGNRSAWIFKLGK